MCSNVIMLLYLNYHKFVEGHLMSKFFILIDWRAIQLQTEENTVKIVLIEESKKTAGVIYF